MHLSKLLLSAVLCTTIYAMETNDPTLGLYVPDINAISNICATILTLCRSQPTVISRDFPDWPPHKIITVSYIDYELCELLLQKDNWYRNICKLYHRNHTTNQVILFNTTDELVHFDEIQEFYQKLIKELQSNWEFGCLRDYPTIGIKKPESTWKLLIKRNSTFDDMLLLRLLLIKFNLLHCAEFDTCWINNDDQPYQGDLYLWIERDKFRQFNEAFTIFPSIF